MVEKPNHSKQFASSSEKAQKSFVPSVGIGTINPGASLDVAGDVTARDAIRTTFSSASTDLNTDWGGLTIHNSNTTANNGAQIWFTSKDTGGTERWVAAIRSVFTARTASTVLADLAFRTNAGDVMRITSTGNVGIGTTSPLTPLHVRVNTDQNLLAVTNANGFDTGATGIASVNDANNAYVPLGFAASRYSFSGGNVGIGTTSPAAALDVTGTGAANVKVEVRGANSQTANLMNWRDYAGSIIAYITSAGNFAATGRVIILGTDATDGGACSPAGSIARDTNGDLFICK